MKYASLGSCLVLLAFCSGCVVVSTQKVDVAGNVNVGATAPAPRVYTGPIQAVHGVSCCLTTVGNYKEGKLVPITAFTSQDVIIFYVAVGWDDPTKAAGIHDIDYNWYKGDKLVSTFSRRALFNRSPADLRTTRAASALGTGHFKAEVQIDKKTVESKEFDIAP